MTEKVASVSDYINQLPAERQAVIQKLREIISTNLPKGFQEEMSYGMIGYVVPHQIYPNGYHCNTKLPLPFINLASQKNFISLYHMGIYMDSEIMNWFVNEYPKHCKTKLDIGKSCIRFKKLDAIPCELLGELAQKFTVQSWIALYEKQLIK